jgi:Phage integrase, N-terminal SAM-like domain
MDDGSETRDRNTGGRDARNALVVPEHRAVAAGGDVVVPAIVALAGPRASRRFLEFFAVTIENPNTRAAYFHACRRFFAWCEHKSLDELVAIEPMHVAAYIRMLGKDVEKPTVKQHLAAIRVLFDWLVVGQVVAINPARALSTRSNAARRRCSRPMRRASFSTASMSRLSWACAIGR